MAQWLHGFVFLNSLSGDRVSKCSLIPLNVLAIGKVLGCCGVSLGVSPLQGWLGPGRADEAELELLFVRGVCATFSTGLRVEAQTRCRAV